MDHHRQRRHEILAKHPEIRRLFGTDASTAWYGVAMLAIHVLVAVGVSCVPRFGYLTAAAAAVLVGAFANLGLLVLLHELSHHLVFHEPRMNRMFALVCNLPLLLPIAEIFNQHHKAHHEHLGSEDLDVDVPFAGEAEFVGNSCVLKFLWVTLSGVILGVRSGMKLGAQWNSYMVVNWMSCLGLGLLLYLTAPVCFCYFAVSQVCCLSFHPSNTRVLQRHIHAPAKDALQKTAPADSLLQASGTHSYYGPWNAFTLNVGCHVEHHDFPRVPWRLLPNVRALAPEYYEQPSHSTRSFADLVRFVREPAARLSM
jgi:sphingolipid delta-4 desaturase